MRQMEGPKRFYRSRKNRMICGVCGGLAEHLNVDPTIVRLFAVFLFFTFFGFVAYIVLCIIVPEEPIVIKEPPKEV